MRALPAALRPNPFNIEEHVMAAVEKGWETDALAKACYIHERNPNPGYIVTNLRNLCLHPPQQVTVRTGWNYGHIECRDPYHPTGCEICRCVPGEVTHHVPSVKPLVTRGVSKEIPND
jgi:hypothetical protein